MKKRLSGIALATAVLSAVVAPAGATHGGIHPTFRQERTYFHCTGATKAYNVNWMLSNGGLSPHRTGWNTNAPTQSVQQGAGCGGWDHGGDTNEFYDVVFEGTFTGNVRDLTIEIHELLLGKVRQTPTETLRLNAWIDNVPLFPPGELPSNGRTVTVTPVPSSTGASERLLFSITNIGYANEIYNSDGELIRVDRGGAALEHGDGTRQHTLRIYLGVHGSGFTTPDGAGSVRAWAWDTTEMPSGITFNPGTLAAATVAADLPNVS